jgi:tetratricopeptide (TPR) repeat protein
MRSVIVCMLVVLLLGGSARAGVESELVQKGVAAYDAVEFARSIELLNQALAESLTREEKVVTWRTLAFAYCALDRIADARAAFARLLKVDPQADLDKSVAPRVRALFEEARAQVATGQADLGEETRLPTLKTEVQPAHPSEGQPVSIAVTAAGGLGRSVALYHRVRGELRYSELKAEGQGGRFALTVTGSAVRAPALEYYLTALDERSTAIARAGGLTQPLVVEVTPRKKPLYTRAWVWGVVGGVVAAGAVLGAVLATTLSPPDPRSAADVMLISPR